MLKRRIVFGGTFDPVHRGHLAAAGAVNAALAPDEFRFLPAGRPPHRQHTFAAPEHRLRMLELALAPCPWATIDRQEIDRTGPSWMSVSLAELRALYPDDALILLLGQDSANSLAAWHDWRRIPELAHLVIMTRPGESPVYGPELAAEIARRSVQQPARLGEQPGGFVLPVPVPPVPVSSTGLREQLASPEVLRALVPESVADYIERHSLYRD